VPSRVSTNAAWASGSIAAARNGSSEVWKLHVVLARRRQPQNRASLAQQIMAVRSDLKLAAERLATGERGAIRYRFVVELRGNHECVERAGTHALAGIEMRF